MTRRAAIDTNILAHALGRHRLRVPDEWMERCRACEQLFERTKELWLPAPVLAEAVKHTEIVEYAKIVEVVGRYRTLPVTAPVALRAGKMLARIHRGQGACSKCGEPDGRGKGCDECGRVPGPASKYADALIAASVLEQTGEWVIYTYNTKDFIALLDGETRVHVEVPPPHQSELALLDHAGVRVDLKVVPRKGTK